MAEKQDALDFVDAELVGNHAELNTKPGVNLADTIAQLRALIVLITEA
jgi:hypothetical protein